MARGDRLITNQMDSLAKSANQNIRPQRAFALCADPVRLPTSQANILVAIAENNDQQGPDVDGHSAQGVRQCAGVETKVFKGANHSWMPPDWQNHNAEAGERGWARKLELFKIALA
jgi:dienelactone hydrolase